MNEVVVVIGAGSIGQAIARRVSAGKHVVLADLRHSNADAAAEVLSNAGFDVTTATVDVSSRQSIHALVETSTALGDITGVIHAAGVSPSQASPEAILHVDLYGTAVLLEEFGNVIAQGGAGVVIASQSGHRLGAAFETFIYTATGAPGGHVIVRSLDTLNDGTLSGPFKFDVYDPFGSVVQSARAPRRRPPSRSRPSNDKHPHNRLGGSWEARLPPPPSSD